MVAVALMGILAALGVPSYMTWIQNTRIRNAAESIQNGIQVARAEAVRRNASVQFTLGANSAWSVGCVNVVDPDCPAVIQSRVAKEGSSADITVVATNAGPYVFNSFGALISPAPTAADSLVRIAVDISTSVLSAADSRDLSVIIGVGGSTRMCDASLDTAGTDPRKCPPPA
jgi:type IV fimbrial biogenesis protein FimT